MQLGNVFLKNTFSTWDSNDPNPITDENFILNLSKTFILYNFNSINNPKWLIYRFLLVFC